VTSNSDFNVTGLSQMPST